MVLCIVFGIKASVCSLFLRFGRRLVLRALRNDENAEIRIPTGPEVKTFQQAFAAQHSTLEDVCSVADGLKLRLEQSSDGMIQNIFYNGWTHDHYISSIFVFAPNGCIIACAINAQGSMHDSTVAEWGNIYSKLESSCLQYGGRCVVDSAFCRGQYPVLIKSAQDQLGSANDLAHVVRLRQAASAGQASEWGMRALQSSFPRLKDRILYEQRGERKLILLSIVKIFSLRSRLVGFNQILSSYMPHMSIEANQILSIQIQ